MMRATIAPNGSFLSLTGALSILGSLAGCASSSIELEQNASLGFICDGGASFRVNFLDGQVRVATSRGIYDLDVRPFSIGRKHASGDTTLILDEERAVLTGADGGPFKRCHGI